MLDFVKRAFLAGVGVAYMTTEKVEQIGKKLMSEAKMSEAEGQKFIDELVKKSEHARSAVDKLVKDGVDAALKKLSVPSKDEVAELKRRIAELEARAKAGS